MSIPGFSNLLYISLFSISSKDQYIQQQMQVIVCCGQLKKTSNAKSELVLSESPCTCLHFVPYNMRLVNIFIITMYGVMKYSLLMSNLVTFCAKLDDIYIKNEFHFALEVSFSI